MFAVFDEAKKLQYVGFSKDIRNSLRTVFSRRPDKVIFYKCAPLNRRTRDPGFRVLGCLSRRTEPDCRRPEVGGCNGSVLCEVIGEPIK